MSDPEGKYGYDATLNDDSDWAVAGYCETNYACFVQTLTTIFAPEKVQIFSRKLHLTKYFKSDLPNGEMSKAKFDELSKDKKYLVRMGCLTDNNYGSWGIVDECMDFTWV